MRSDAGKQVAERVVCLQLKVLGVFSFLAVSNTQPAVLVAPTQACALTSGKNVNVYTYSQ